MSQNVPSGAESTSTTSIPSQDLSIRAYQPRFDRQQPVIAVVAENSFTELTDYVVPYGVLAESGVARVLAIATEPEPIRMFPALRVEPQATIAQFDDRFPEGADYVIVPAVLRQKDPVLLGWLGEQARKGAIVAGICDGVWVLANAGLLDGRKGVGHWFSLSSLARKFPKTEWLRNTRYVADGNVITTTGVSASVPVSIALVEAIAGRDRAASLARSLGVENWGAQHDSKPFKLGIEQVLTAIGNWLSFWSSEEIGLPIHPGTDEVALSLMADSYSRTWRSKAFALSDSAEGVTSKRGLRILPDRISDEDKKVDRTIELDDRILPVAWLDTTLQDIEGCYGSRTAAFVALQLEYPRDRSETRDRFSS